MKKIFLAFVLSMFLISLVSAADVALIVKTSGNSNIVSVLNELNYTYDIIKETQIPSANFSNYAVLLIQDEVNNKNYIQFDSKNLIFLQKDDVPNVWSSALVGQSSALYAKFQQLGTPFTEGFTEIDFRAYTLQDTVYYLKTKPAYVKKVVLKDGSTVAYPIVAYSEIDKRKVFFGFPGINYWTADTKKLFKNSVKWTRQGEDFDGDGFYTDLDCNDNDASINPGAEEIPYDGKDNDCSGEDLVDVDEDGFDAEIVGGEDCNDNNSSINPNAEEIIDNIDQNCRNDAPFLINNISDISWNEDEKAENAADLKDYFRDYEKDDLIFIVNSTSENKNITLKINESMISFYSDADWNGNDWVVFRAVDSGGKYGASNIINLQVNPVNDAPVLNVQPVKGVEGEVLDISASATDADGDALVFTFASPFNSNGEWHTNLGDAGTYTSEVKVSDGKLEDNKSVAITVLAKAVINEFEMNDKDGKEWVELYNPAGKSIDISGYKIFDGLTTPTLRHTVPDGTLLESKGFYAADVHGLNNNDDFVTLKDADGNKIDETPVFADESGDVRVWARKTDGLDNNNESDWVFQPATKGISNLADVDTPVLNPISNKTIFENDTFAFMVSGYDLSDDELVLSAVGLPDGAVFETATGKGNVDNEFSWKPDFNQSGTYNIEFILGDGKTQTKRNVTIKVINVNRNPVLLSEIPDQTWNEDENLSINLNSYFEDPDGDSLAYTSSKLTNFAIKITGNTALITPKKDWFGSESINFTASDGQHSITSNIINLNVTPVNDAPVLEAVADISVEEGAKAIINAKASDIDNSAGELVYSINNSRFEKNISRFTWQTGYADSGVYYFELKSSDGKLEDKKTVKVTVRDVNEPPYIFIEEQQIAEDFGGRYANITAYDNDGFVKEFKVVSQDASKVKCSVEYTDKLLKFESVKDWNGIGNKSAACIIEAIDDKGKATAYTVKINVTPVNDAPEIKNIIPGFSPIIKKAKQQGFSVSISDIDSPASAITAEWSVNGQKIANSLGSSFTFNESNLGKYEIGVVASDGELSSSNSWNASVVDRPVVESYSGNTTDFSGMNESELGNVALVLEKAGGKVEFLVPLDLRNSVDFENYAGILNSIIAIDTNYLSALKNKQAKVIFYGLRYTTTPSIYYNSGFTLDASKVNNACPLSVCQNVSYEPGTGTLSFIASGFSSYKVGDLASCSSQGGRVCSENEYCSGTLANAIEDKCCVGSCLEIPPSFKDVDERCANLSSKVQITIKQPEKNDEFKVGEDIEFELKLKNKDKEDRTFDVYGYLYDLENEEVVSEKSDDLDVEKNHEEELTLTFKVPSTAHDGDKYAAFVYVDDNEVCSEGYVKINIEKEKHDVAIESLKIAPDVSACRQSVNVDVIVNNLGQKKETVYLTIENKELGIEESTEEFELKADSKKSLVTRHFEYNIPENAVQGNYKIKAKLYYNDEVVAEEQSLLLGECLQEVQEKFLQDEIKLNSETQKLSGMKIEKKTPSLTGEVVNILGGGSEQAMFVNIALIAGILICLVAIIIKLSVGRRARRKT